MKRIYACIVGSIVSMPALWAVDLPSAALYNLELMADTAASQLTVSFDVRASELAPGSDARFVFAPVVRGAGNMCDTLPAATVAGRTRYYRMLRSRTVEPLLVRAGSDTTLHYCRTIALPAGFDEGSVSISVTKTGCCGKPSMEASISVADLDLVHPSFMAPDFIAEAPAVADGKTVEIKGSAFIDFRVNRTEIDPLYRANPKELAKIINTIEQVREVPDASITSISIRGYASPEGSWENNTRLANGRTAALRDYLMAKYGFADSMFECSSCPEDWAGLRDTVAALALPNSPAIIELIDSDMEPDRKEAAIRRRFPAEYSYLHSDIYPALRHSDYAVRYNIRQYTDLDEIRRVMRERPANLSLHEYHLLASSYPAGSPERKEVFGIAVRVYPHDEISNINAAASALAAGDLEGAKAYLANAGDGEQAVYLRGIAAAYAGDYTTAESLLSTASGVPQAAEALAAVRDITEHSEAVRYTAGDDVPKLTK